MDLNCKYKQPQRTLLHYAAEAGQNKVLKVLLRRQANAEIHAGERSLTPLHLAVRMGQEKSTELLLKYGADVEARSLKGYTPLHHASRCGKHEIGKLLIASGAKVNAISGLDKHLLSMCIRGRKIFSPVIYLLDEGRCHSALTYCASNLWMSSSIIILLTKTSYLLKQEPIPGGGRKKGKREEGEL